MKERQLFHYYYLLRHNEKWFFYYIKHMMDAFISKEGQAQSLEGRMPLS